MISSPVTEEDLVLHALNGTVIDFKETANAISARESHISLNELLDKLIEYVKILKHQDSTFDITIPNAHFAARPINMTGTGLLDLLLISQVHQPN